MFRLLTLLISVGCLAAFVWFGVTVDLGDRTLFGHLRAISGSKESQELWKGAKEKVTGAISAEAERRAKAKAAEKPGQAEAKAEPAERPSAEEKAAPPQDHITDTDREAMRKLIGSAQAQNKPK